jgi:cysteine desulfuration protein SufE
MANPRIESLIEDFELLTDWEERYRYVIELGRELDPMPDALKTPVTKVQGCASQVWIHARTTRTGGEPVLTFTGDSDALIVKGLIAVVFRLYSGETARTILATDATPVLDRLGLKDHLTPQRSNGLASMVKRIKADAQAALASA